MKKKFGDRRDGKRVKVDGLHQLCIDLKPRRCDSDVYINQKIDVTNLVDYIEEKKDKVTEVKGTTLTLKDMDFLKSLTSNAEIRDEWKESILSFAGRMGISIDDTFWNVGNLTISKSLINPM